MGIAAVVLENRVAYRDAFIADVGPGIIAGRRDQFGHSVLRLVTERAAQCFFRSRARFHGWTTPRCLFLNSARWGCPYVGGRTMISSMIPYSLACCEFMMKSRSTSRSMRSSG